VENTEKKESGSHEAPQLPKNKHQLRHKQGRNRSKRKSMINTTNPTIINTTNPTMINTTNPTMINTTNPNSQAHYSNSWP
jgi:hypothetical protein